MSQRPLLETLRCSLCAALAVVLSGCGGGGGDPPSGSSCSLSTAVFGGTTIQIEADEATTCATLNSIGAGVSATLIGPESKGRVELDIDNVTEGQIGTAFPTTVIVQDAAANRWQGPCLTDITEHSLIKADPSTIGELRHHQVAGTVTCSSPLTPLSVGSSGTASVDHLEFRAQVSWRD